MRRRYVAYVTAHDGLKPLYYNRRAWSALPAEYARRLNAE
jgi:hypothetical protein